MEYNVRPISIRDGKIIIDGVEAGDSVSASGVFTLATRCPKSPGNFWTLPTSPGRMSSALCSSSQR